MKPEPQAGRRLVEIDALRGVAALAVVFFHYTTRFAELYPQPAKPTISFPDGHYGVNLFFIISGFVIFMTLEKTRRPMDFVVSRFSRLFPAYWFAIPLTFCVTHWLGLPGKLVDLPSAIGNTIMLHGLLNIPHVDGVYWTLEVELLFYVGMFTLYRLNGLGRIHLALIAMLSLRVAYFLLERFAGIDLPWTIFRLLILAYLPWFSLGVAVYLAINPRDAKDPRRSALLAAAAIGTLLVAESIPFGLLACALAGLVYLAASGRAPFLRHPVLAWLGAISYPLYLVHENIGWSLQLQALRHGLPIDASVVLALASSLALATAITRWVEQPAMRWIRRRYKASRPEAPRAPASRARRLIGLALVAGLLLAAAAGVHALMRHRENLLLDARLARLMPISTLQHPLDCRELAAGKPLVLLAIGQSNAGNHGPPPAPGALPIRIVAGGRCLLASDPLPGSTGNGASLWSLLPDQLLRAGLARPVVLSVMGIDGTSIRDWSRADSPLLPHLLAQIGELQRLGLPPDLILWQQGETDARNGISADQYSHGLAALVAAVRGTGLASPFVLARSTVCKSAPSEEIRRALELALQHDPSLRRGPDTDLLHTEADRRDGCHFSHAGLARAARLWAETLTAEVRDGKF